MRQYKNRTTFSIFLFISLFFLFHDTSCFCDKVDHYYKIFIPIFNSKMEIAHLNLNDNIRVEIYDNGSEDGVTRNRKIALFKINPINDKMLKDSNSIRLLKKNIKLKKKHINIDYLLKTERTREQTMLNELFDTRKTERYINKLSSMHSIIEKKSDEYLDFLFRTDEKMNFMIESNKGRCVYSANRVFMEINDFVDFFEPYIKMGTVNPNGTKLYEFIPEPYHDIWKVFAVYQLMQGLVSFHENGYGYYNVQSKAVYLRDKYEVGWFDFRNASKLHKISLRNIPDKVVDSKRKNEYIDLNNFESYQEYYDNNLCIPRQNDKTIKSIICYRASDIRAFGLLVIQIFDPFAKKLTKSYDKDDHVGNFNDYCSTLVPSNIFNCLILKDFISELLSVNLENEDKLGTYYPLFLKGIANLRQNDLKLYIPDNNVFNDNNKKIKTDYVRDLMTNFNTLYKEFLTQRFKSKVDFCNNTVYDPSFLSIVKFINLFSKFSKYETKEISIARNAKLFIDSISTSNYSQGSEIITERKSNFLSLTEMQRKYSMPICLYNFLNDEGELYKGLTDEDYNIYLDILRNAISQYDNKSDILKVYENQLFKGDQNLII